MQKCERYCTTRRLGVLAIRGDSNVCGIIGFGSLTLCQGASSLQAQLPRHEKNSLNPRCGLSFIKEISLDFTCEGFNNVISSPVILRYGSDLVLGTNILEYGGFPSYISGKYLPPVMSPQRADPAMRRDP
jgi:hypothetical protein